MPYADAVIDRPTRNAEPDAAQESARRLLALVEGLLHELRPATTHARPVSLDDSLERDLGIDSLSRVELAARIEATFGVRLGDEAALYARTPRELFDAIVNAAPTSRAEGLARAPLPAVAAVEGTPASAATLLAALAWHVERHPQREHVTLIDGERVVETLTYAALSEAAHRIAAALLQRDVGRGDAVAIVLPTGAAFLETFLGVLLVGAVAVPLYPPVRWTEIEAHVRGRTGILANCNARLLVTVPEARFVAALVRAELPNLRMVASPRELLDAHAPHAHLRAPAPDDTAMLQYTSGSTGDPKGVVLSHAQLLANIRAMGTAAAVTASDRFVSWLPLYHDMGLIGAWLGSLYYAVPLTLMPPTSFLARPVRWLRAIHRFGATLSAAPNFAYEVAATKIPAAELEGLELRAWRLAFNGAEPVRAATLERFATRFAPYGFDRRALTPVYGLAESAVGLAFPPLGRGPQIDRIDAARLSHDGVAVPATPGQAILDQVSCGRPLPGYEIRVVDDTGRELPSRREGRIEFRGPSATRGYFANREATRQLVRGTWLDTGDAGYVAAGELYVTSRIKDLIKRGGHNIHPYDLEAALGELPDVRKGCVAVFGALDPVSGSERVIVVVETSVTDAALRSALRREVMSLASFYLDGPADDVVLAAPHTVLKTSSGKIRRSACRELYERGLLEARRRAPWEQMLRLVVHAAIARTRRAGQRAAHVAYGLYAMLMAVAVALPSVALLAILPSERSRMQLMRGAARLLLRLCGVGVRLHGGENLDAKPAVFVANHASYLDAIVLCAVLPPFVRHVPKRAFSRMPLLGYAMRRSGAWFVDRDDATRGVEDAARIAGEVRRGSSVLFFPEGTFTRVPGLRPFHLGAFSVAAQAGVPVVPVVLRGTRAILRDGQRLPTRGAVDVEIAPAMAPNGDAWESVIELRDRVRAAMLARCDEPDLA